tara:strand:- start:436 stop:951 length:516 start_codon:yes stop_codon:yes gene_type:complete
MDNKSKGMGRMKQLKSQSDNRKKVESIKQKISTAKSERAGLVKKLSSARASLSEAKDKRDRARKKAMLEIQQEGLRKKGKVYDSAIKRLKKQETAAKVISGAGLLVPGGGALKVGAKGLQAGAKAVSKKVTSSAAKRLNRAAQSSKSSKKGKLAIPPGARGRGFSVKKKKK